MNGRERMLSAFQHNEPDRVPIYEQAFASDVASNIIGKKVFTGGTSLHYEEALSWMKGEDTHGEFEEKVFKDRMTLTEYFEFDAMGLPWRLKQKPTKQIDEYTFLYGQKDKQYSVYRFDPDSKCFGKLDTSERNLDADDIPRIVQAQEKRFTQRKPLSAESFRGLKRLMDAAGDRLMILGSGGIGIPYEPAAWLEATILYPDAVDRYLDMATETLMESIKIQADMGIKVIWGGGDMASKNGPFYSPDTFRKLMLPHLKQVTNLCNELGIYYLFRSDGNLWPVSRELFEESEIHGYGEIEGDAGMDLARLKREFGHLTFWGNLSCDVLRRGSKNRVIEEVKNCIDAAAGRGGYIFGTSNAILSGTPPENVVAMIETAKKHGKY